MVPSEDVERDKFDGLIITGAPVEQMPFEEVEYWDELKEIMDWAEMERRVHLPYLLGGAQLTYISYGSGIPNCDLPRKMFGVYRAPRF